MQHNMASNSSSSSGSRLLKYVQSVLVAAAASAVLPLCT
jgi:hypothetical protein